MGIDVRFHAPGAVADGAVTFAVVAARHKGKWIFCKHRARDTWEMPGGHREPGETPLEAAARELYEETGAEDFSLREICIYSVTIDDVTTYGTLNLAQVKSLGPLPASEIGEVGLFDALPAALTYPEIQPLLLRKIKELEGMDG